MSAICGWYGISRQAYYQQVRRDGARTAQEQQVLELVRQQRQKHPRLGTRKLLHELRDALQARGIRMGRDRLFDLLRRAGLLIGRRRNRRRTTWSGAWHSPNLLQEVTVTAPNQAWVSDITYVETEERFGYLCLVMDHYSRYILGFDFCDSLAVEGAQRALAMAVRQAGGATANTILHSDHGIQYTCHAFREDLDRYLMRASMGQVGNCYENAHAERLNGILKQEYALDQRFLDLAQARRAILEAIWLYNHERPHLSLNYRKPVQVHFDVAQPVLSLSTV
jgi:transposase InsO family protein